MTVPSFAYEPISSSRAGCVRSLLVGCIAPSTDDGIWAIHFNTVLLATFDERDYIITG